LQHSADTPHEQPARPVASIVRRQGEHRVPDIPPTSAKRIAASLVPAALPQRHRHNIR
jgi:hypothetical protein